MKAKKVLALSMALATVAAASTTAFAAELTNTNPSGSTEVTAKILSGEVSYVITIPDKADFGDLEQPAEAGDSYKDVNYTVTATDIKNLPSNSRIIVYVKDENADPENTQFYLTQQVESNPTQLIYDVYDKPSEEINDSINSVNQSSTFDQNYGYQIVLFSKTGQSLTGTLRLNQAQLYGKDINEIAGDYSGHMVFSSSIYDIPTN